MENPATIEDVELRFGQAVDTEQVHVLLDDAWALLVSRIPSLPVWIEAGKVDRQNVVRVLCAAVIRVLKNPDGIRQQSVDDTSTTWDTAISSGELYFSDNELAGLRVSHYSLPGMYAIKQAVPYAG